MISKNKLLFVTHIFKDDTNGVWKKVNQQVKAFVELGIDVDFIYLDCQNVIIENTITKKIEKYPFKFKYYSFKIISHYVNKKYDFLYLRKPHGGLYPLFVNALVKKVVSLSPGISIYMEIPTYPYKNEINTLKEKVSDFVFDMTFPFYKKDIKSILYIGEYAEKIYGVNAKKISNGINLNENHSLGKDLRNKDTFIFCGVANLKFWHGYDRVIRSISEYEGPKEIYFYIVGDNEPEYSKLKLLSHELKVTNKIKFLGKLNSLEINSVLEKVNVCVDALGRHRSGNNYNSSIKSKEYTASGIPFIKSHIDDSFGDEIFIKQIDATDNTFKVEDIIDWYDALPDNFIMTEINYAKNNFDWKTILKCVIDK